MAKTCENLPINVTGPFEQTLFLGCSIQSVSTSLGWNEQQSSVTVTLVEDDCPSHPDKPKVYYPGPGRKYCWHDADPGFTSPTIGAPVYFRIGSDPAWPVRENDKSEGEGFEFSGIIQSWTKDYSPNGNPTYTVQIVDPRLLLQNLEIIISDYAGAVYGGTGPPVYNLINAYGWLEWAAGGACPQNLVLGANFGSPAGGFGGSMNNNEGTPWHELRNAIQYLLSGNTGKAVGAGHGGPPAKFSPYGYAKFRGSRPQDFENEGNPGDFVDTNKSSNSKDHHGGQGMGILNHDDYEASIISVGDNANGNPYIADYIIDISDIPYTPRWYRLAGPSMNLLDMISQICAEAGSDYYVELLVTPTEQKVIKVRTVKRAVQPEVGGENGIEQFIEDVENVTSKNISRELRNEPTSVFVYGGYVQTVYQQIVPTGILQYWGKDSLGNHHVNCRIPCAAPFNTTRETGDWAIYLDIRPLNLNLTTAIPTADGYIWISETEIRLALGDFDAWYNYCLIYNNFIGTPIGQAMGGTHNAKPNIEFPVDLIGNAGAGAGAADKMKKAVANAFENLLAGGFAINFATQDPRTTADQDIKKIHEFIQNWADTYYGKQFLVQLPYVCYSLEPDSQQVLFSDNPTNDGGYPAEGTTNVLDLPWSDGVTPEPLDYFSDEQNKILPFARYFLANDGAYPREGEWIASAGCCRRYDTAIYIKGAVEEQPFAYTVGANTYATALFKVENPIEVSGSITDTDSQFAGMLEIAFGNDGLSTPTLDAVDFGVRFNPDGGRGDTAFSIAPRRRQPNEVAVPMKSNTTRYGPLSWNGPPGPVTFSADDGLVPWEYGGYGSVNPIDRMWGAMVETARDSLSMMQVGERGSANFPGYPTRRLGEELRSSQKMMDSMFVENETFNLLQGGSFTLKKLRTVIGGQSYWDGSFGPNITNITINIGADGFTTNYTLSTFSPSFGRFAKYNANKLKQSGRQRAEIMRMQREQNKLRRALVASMSRAAAQIKDLKGKRPTKQAPDGASSVFAGTSSVDGRNIDGDVVIPNVSTQTPRTLLHGNPDTWAEQGFMSSDGLFRPISNDGAGTTLPPYSEKNATNPKDDCDQIPHTRRESNPPFNGAAPKNYVQCIIDVDYLDPWAFPAKDKHEAAATKNVATNHPDINIFSHGAAAVVKQNMFEYSVNNAYPQSVRGIANKGPLLLHGWGYDIDGKPIPNAADNEADARDGKFEDENLKDEFYSHYLRKPHMWPVGPVDLRWDRKRAVWTVPNEFKLIQAYARQSIPPGVQIRDCMALNMGTPDNPVYDENGLALNNLIDVDISVTNPTWQCLIPKGASFYVIYDSIDCTYYPLWPSGFKVRDSGYCGEVSEFERACLDKCTSCLNFSSGLKIANFDGEGSATVIADHWILDSAYCDYQPDPDTSPADFEFFNQLTFRSGLKVGRVSPLSPCGYVIDADHYISSTGSTCDATDKTINDEFFSHLSFGSGFGVHDKGNCKYEIYSCGSGGGGGGTCITGTNLTCESSLVDYGFSSDEGTMVPSPNLSDDTAHVGSCMSGLVAGPGLSLYKITGATPQSGSHYIQSNLKISSGCCSQAAEEVGDCDWIYNVEEIKLGCGLSGTMGPLTRGGGDEGGSPTGVCSMTISLDPLSCYEGIEPIRYVHDLCCSGAGFQVIYRYLMFSSCGLFTGITGDGGCVGE